MIFPLGVALELRFVEIHLSQISGAVTLGLVVEMWLTPDCRFRRPPSRLARALFLQTRRPQQSCFRSCHTTFLFPGTGARRKTLAIPTPPR